MNLDEKIEPLYSIYVPSDFKNMDLKIAEYQDAKHTSEFFEQMLKKNQIDLSYKSKSHKRSPKDDQANSGKACALKRNSSALRHD